MNNYAVKILQDELQRLEKAVKETKAWSNYPEAYKDRAIKIKQLKKAIELNK